MNKIRRALQENGLHLFPRGRKNSFTVANLWGEASGIMVVGKSTVSVRKPGNVTAFFFNQISEIVDFYST